MAITIKKIAELAGVSAGTVDRVINKRGKVNPQIEERILKIIQEVDYRPNLMAKSLALKKHSPKIGVIFHVKTTNYFDEVTKGIEKAQKEISDFGIKVIVKASKNFEPTSQLEIIDELLEEGVKVIAITPINDIRIADKIDELIANGFPIFCFINDVQTKYEHPFIGINAYETGYFIGGIFHLITQGSPEKLAVITPSLSMLGHTQRIQGLRDCLEHNHPNISLQNICEIPSSQNQIQVYNTVKEYFQRHTDITCLLYATSASDGGIVALEELGLLHKIKIITLDIQQFIAKGLEEGYIAASLSQNPYDQGYLTIKAIYNYFTSETYNAKLKLFVTPKILIKENYKNLYPLSNTYIF